MTMHEPPHPGFILKTLYLDTAEISLDDAAKGLAIQKDYLNQLIKGEQSISLGVAVRLAQAFTNTTPDIWLKMQSAYDELEYTQMRHFPCKPHTEWNLTKQKET